MTTPDHLDLAADRCSAALSGLRALDLLIQGVYGLDGDDRAALMEVADNVRAAVSNARDWLDRGAGND